MALVAPDPIGTPPMPPRPSLPLPRLFPLLLAGTLAFGAGCDVNLGPQGITLGPSTSGSPGAQPTPIGGLATAAPLFPEIVSLDAKPSAVGAKDQAITLTFVAVNKAGGTLSYSWSASAGTLDSTTASAVNWKPQQPDGAIKAGDAAITLRVSNGRYAAASELKVRIAADGSAQVLGKAAPAGSPGPVPRPSGELPCKVGELVPTWVPAGGFFYVSGQAFQASPAIKAAGQPAPVVTVAPGYVAARLPENLNLGFGETRVPVGVSACEAEGEASGALQLTDLTGFPQPAGPGQGLLAVVAPTDPNASGEAPGALQPAGSFLLGKVDVPASAFRFAFPAMGGRYTLRIAGQLAVAKAGATGFSLDDAPGARLYVDNKLVVDGREARSGATIDGTATLSAGKHLIMLDWPYDGRPRPLALYWRPAGQGEAIVPATAFTLAEPVGFYPGKPGASPSPAAASPSPTAAPGGFSFGF
jgi:hypothetical protein